jgi:6-phosphofructokinase 2
MIATLTLNPCLDRYITVAGLAPNETNRSQPVKEYAGGKGIDVARAINEMGGSTIAFGLVGGHDGRTMAAILRKEKIPVELAPIKEETRACYIIMDSTTGQQTRISAPGPNVMPGDTRRLLARIWRLKPAPVFLVCGGSVPPSLPEDIYASIIAEARQNEIRTILDSSGNFLKAGIKARPFLVKPNVTEAEDLLGRKLTGETEIIQAGRDIISLGVTIAVISRGAQGLIAFSQDEIIKAVPPQVEILSTVGAGDCAVAGLALRLAEGASLTEACRLAVAMGTAAVISPGTGLARRADVDKLLPQIKVEIK